jgi:parallel beta-helix repeat protein
MLRSTSVALVATIILLSATAFAGTYVVGTCKPNLPFFDYIQEAVSSVPPGSTILVCPGTYAEQVVISRPLKLEGLAGESDAVIVSPQGGLTKSAQRANFFRVYYQILVKNTAGPVEISNLAVDGTGGASKNQNVAGILYLDASGTVSNVSARNEPAFGTGIFAATAGARAETVTIQDSMVRGLDGSGGYGIVVYRAGGALTANVTGNTIRQTNNLGPTGYGSGIQALKTTGLIQSNTIVGTGYGLYLSDSSMAVTGNTISTVIIGVDLLSGSNTVKNNRIDAGGAMGITLDDQGTGTVVQGNTIENSSVAVYGCGDGYGFGYSTGFTVTGNTILDATTGMQMPPYPNGNVTAPNTYYATGAAVSAQPCN